MTKYKEYFKKMLEENKVDFDAFQEVHDKYHLDPDSWQDEFNHSGEKIMNIVRDYEARLCKTSEKGGYSLFSGGLAEKFQSEVRRQFPMIDHIGIIVKKKLKFNIKKINLNAP